MGRTRLTAAGTAAVAVIGVLGGCGGGHSSAAGGGSSTTPPGSAVTTATTAAPATNAPTTAAPASAATTAPAAPTTTTFSHGVVGAIVSGVGTTLVPPASPTTVAYNPSCQVLIDPGYQGQCVILAAPSGTIAAIVETQVQAAGSATSPAASRDLVYHRVGATWQLALRRVTTGTEDTVEESDVQRDGDPKAVFTVPATNAQYVDELDVVEGTGAVTLYRQLHGGFATVAPGGGLETLTPSAAPATGYDEATVTYSGGSWRITADTQVSLAQAQALSNGSGFYDPDGTRATFFQGAG